jgi:hypothetical protein
MQQLSSKAMDMTVEERRRKRSENLAGLLHAYAKTLSIIDEAPPAISLRRSRSWYGLLILPASRFCVRSLLAAHCRQRVGRLAALYYGEAAVETSPEVTRADRERLEYFSRALPLIPYRVVVLGFLGAAAAVSILMSTAVAYFDVQLGIFVRETWLHVFTLDFSRVLRGVYGLNGVPGFQFRDAVLFYAAVLIMSLAVYVPLNLLVSSYRLVRILLNEYPRASLPLDRGIVVSDHVYGCTGIFRLESHCFSNFGRRRPPEIPLEILCRCIVPVVVLLMFLVLFPPSWLEGFRWYRDSSASTVMAFLRTSLIGLLVALPILGLSLARITWVIRTSRSRSRTLPLPAPTEELHRSDQIRTAGDIAVNAGLRGVTILGYGAGMVLVSGLNRGPMTAWWVLGGLGLFGWGLREVIKALRVGSRAKKRRSGGDCGDHIRARSGRELGWIGLSFAVCFVVVVIVELMQPS